MIIWESDEIKCRSPNFVTLRKNYILRLKHWWRAKWIWTIASHILYRFQYRKIKWGLLKKVWSKKMFSLKSMTKLEDLTVLLKSPQIESAWEWYTVIHFLWVSAKFGTCAVVSINGPLVEAKMFTFTLESIYALYLQLVSHLPSRRCKC